MKKKKNDKIIVMDRSEVTIEYGKDKLLDNYKMALSCQEQIQDLINELEEENKKVQELYYSLDTQISNALSRTFIELVKLFIERHFQKNERSDCKNSVNTG